MKVGINGDVTCELSIFDGEIGGLGEGLAWEFCLIVSRFEGYLG